MPYYLVHANDQNRFLCGLAVDPTVSDTWIPRWTTERKRAYKFYAIGDIRRYRDTLLDQKLGPYKILQSQVKQK